MKVYEINTNLCGEDPNGCEVIQDPFFGETIKVGIYLDPKSLRNFNGAKGIFILNGDIHFLLIEHQIVPHGNLFCSLKELPLIRDASIFCKINMVDIKKKELIVNNYYNYPDYETIIEDIRKFVDEKYKGWKVTYTKETKNIMVDTQHRNLYKI